MWPRLSRAIRDNPITALVSALAAFLAFFWQIHQYRKECAASLSLPQCIMEIALSPAPNVQPPLREARDLQTSNDAPRNTAHPEPPPDTHFDERMADASKTIPFSGHRAYWDMYNKDSDALSVMYSLSDGNAIRFYYERPSKYLKGLVTKDTLKFEGEKNGNQYHGTAYVFTEYCGGKSLGYEMNGSEDNNGTSIILQGQAPVFDTETCRVHHFTWDSNNSSLEFRERTAKAKRNITDDQFRR